MITLICTILSGIAFLIYGISCVFSEKMIDEFARFGLSRFRVIVGVLQILGGAGLLLGLYCSKELIVCSGIGLFLLMVLGVGVRVYIKDSFIQTIPALLLAILNLFISLFFLAS